MILRTIWHNANPNTIWNQLAVRLGREPTNAEAAAEVRRIMSEAMIEAAVARQACSHQRKR